MRSGISRIGDQSIHRRVFDLQLHLIDLTNGGAVKRPEGEKLSKNDRKQRKPRQAVKRLSSKLTGLTLATFCAEPPRIGCGQEGPIKTMA